MSTPAGWYDDGSGRQRWWDGTQWTEHFAPVEPVSTTPPSTGTPEAQTQQYPPSVAATAQTEQYAPYTPPAQTAAYPGLAGSDPSAPVGSKAPIIGYIALGLAAVGTVLAFFPPIVSIFAFFLLFVAFVMSIVGLFIKGTVKWPSITGLILSVVGTIIGIVMFVVLTVVAVQEYADNLPSPGASTSQSAEPSDAPTDAAPSGSRPTVDEVKSGLTIIIDDLGGGTDDYSDAQLTCIAQYFVDSDIPDEKLAIIADGTNMYEDLDAATEFAEKFGESLPECLF